MYSRTELKIMDTIVAFCGHDIRSPMPIYYNMPGAGSLAEPEAIMGYEQVDAVTGYLHAAHGVKDEHGVSLLGVPSHAQCKKAVESVLTMLLAVPDSTSNLDYNRGEWRALGRKIYTVEQAGANNV